MGATGSSNSIHSPPPAPTSPLRGVRSEETSTFVYGAGEPHCPEYANEHLRERTRTSGFDLSEEPRSQGPSPYTTLRGDEWNQRPSAPSLTNLRPPQRETLLTYAAQMTGWQTSEGHGPSFSQQQQDIMELSRIISQLAMANQQLASAHNTTLAHLETLYVELMKERELKRRGVSSDSETLDEALRKRLTDEETDEEKRRMELRIDKLETLLTESFDACQTRERNSRHEEDKKLLSRIERLENLTKRRFEEEALRFVESTSTFNDERRGDNEDSSMAQNRQKDSDNGDDRILSSAEHEVPECKLKYQSIENQGDIDDENRTRCNRRIHRSRSDDEGTKSKMKVDVTRSNLHLEKSKEEGSIEERQVDNTRGKSMEELTEEMERLKAERLEYQNSNERLEIELAEQKTVMETLTNNCEESKTRCAEAESRLQEGKEDYEKLSEKLDVAKKEIERLLKEVDTFNLEKDTAEARISSLEQELQKSVLEKEQVKSTESQKTLKLRAQLSEEVSDKKKQIKALEDALDEIQRLKETIKTERRNGDDDDSKEDIVPPVESIDESQECSLSDRASNIEEFKKELTLKREARQRAIAAVSSEMERLRRELDAEKEAHSETSRVLDLLRSAQNESQCRPLVSGVDGSFRRSRMKEQKPDEHEVAVKRAEAQRLTSLLKVSDELRNDVRFQIEKVDDLRYQLETEPEQHRYRIRCLTEITNKAREAVSNRERRANELKDHLAQILVRLGDRSFLDLKDEAGLECERQLENINSLKSLYNERLKMLTELKEAAVRELADVKERLDHSLKKSECLEEDLRKADEKIDAQDTEISNLESQLGLTKADCRDLQNQMSLINGLFTQMLLGASSADMDLDRLTQLLQENHDLISDMAREEGTEAAALPKLLLELVEQVEGSKGVQKRDGENNSTEGEIERKEDDLQQEDIAHNLPKVWRVLLELLSCHAEGASSASVAPSPDPNSCYKSVDTPAGPRLVISVSKTYIRLKELILEKKHLEKEMNRMKQLNTHLESKLGEQEKRLSAVSAELSKTWNIVDRMQAQHQQLHTHEKILRYELQQKRKMLQELKQELEYCREKWESARQKNTNTELEWRSLRREFAARKALAVHDSFNNSAESGFSDERGDDTDEEDNANEERIRVGPRRRSRKENQRVPSPDTESEQPTDTELSEPKTEASVTLEQRTSTPETEAELEEIEAANLDEESVNIVETINSEDAQEPMDPLDQALTNVIQNLIRMDDETESATNSSTCESLNDNTDVTEDTNVLITSDDNSLTSDTPNDVTNATESVTDATITPNLDFSMYESLNSAANTLEGITSDTITTDVHYSTYEDANNATDVPEDITSDTITTNVNSLIYKDSIQSTGTTDNETSLTVTSGDNSFTYDTLNDATNVSAAGVTLDANSPTAGSSNVTTNMQKDITTDVITPVDDSPASDNQSHVTDVTENDTTAIITLSTDSPTSGSSNVITNMLKDITTDVTTPVDDSPASDNQSHVTDVTENDTTARITLSTDSPTSGSLNDTTNIPEHVTTDATTPVDDSPTSDNESHVTDVTENNTTATVPLNTNTLQRATSNDTTNISEHTTTDAIPPIHNSPPCENQHNVTNETENGTTATTTPNADSPTYESPNYVTHVADNDPTAKITSNTSTCKSEDTDLPNPEGSSTSTKLEADALLKECSSSSQDSNSTDNLEPPIPTVSSHGLSSIIKESDKSQDGEKDKIEESLKPSLSQTSTVPSPASAMSIFSIGPFPQATITPSSIKSVQFSDPLIVGPSNRLFAPVFGASISDTEENQDRVSVSSSSLSAVNQEVETKDQERPSFKPTENTDSDSISVDSSSSLETVKEFATASTSAVQESSDLANPEASSSVKRDESKVLSRKARTPEEALAAREDRLRRLEEQAEWLMKKMNATSRRGSALSTRLEELHEAYGEPPVPPPMPDVLPSRRLRTNLSDLPRQVPESSSTENNENVERLIPRRRSDESPANDVP